jgi:hypothetical protein
MSNHSGLTPSVLRRDGARCRACGISVRQVLVVHHMTPVEWGGRDLLSNLTTLCANCHRIVHWLSVGDRSLEAHGYGLGPSRSATRRLLALARRIRRRRLRVVGNGRVLSTSVPLSTAMTAVIARNGLDTSEAAAMKRCFRRALRSMALADRRACSVHLVRGARFISVNANNHLVIRVPAWSDAGYRVEGDILLIWPQATRPSVISPRRFRRESSERFRLIPHFNLSLTWDECIAMTKPDWLTFRRACHDALTLVRTRGWTSNVVL